MQKNPFVVGVDAIFGEIGRFALMPWVIRQTNQ